MQYPLDPTPSNIIVSTDIDSEAKLETVSNTDIETEAEAAADISTHNTGLTAHGQVAGVFPIAKGGTGATTATGARLALGIAGAPADVGTVTTTDATPAIVLTLAIADSSCKDVSARVTARRSDGSAHARFLRTALFYREGAGAVMLDQYIPLPDATHGNPSWIAELTMLGNDCIVRVTGSNGETVRWDAIAESISSPAA